MSSFINKIANTVTNSTGSIIGRDNLTKLSNSINRSFVFKSKYRDFMHTGNVVQIISKKSHMSLQICASRNDPNRLILLGNGQIGLEYLNAHFLIEIDAKSGHYKFRNRNNFIAYDNDVPCVLEEKVNPKNNKEAIRARNQFRLHELIGSQEYFALESVYYAGRYLSVLPDGSITTTRNKADESAHFCLNVISVSSANLKPNAAPFMYVPPVVSVSEAADSRPISQMSDYVPGPTAPAAAATGYSAPPSSSSASSSPNTSNRNSQTSENASVAYNKEGEAIRNDQQPSENGQVDQPPAYSNIFPKLPQ